MKLENILINIESDIIDIYKSFNKTSKKFCIIEKNKKIIWVISDGDIIRHISDDWKFNIKVNEVVNKNFKYLINWKHTNQDILNLFLKENILFIPILNKDKSLNNIILKDKFYEQILLQDKILDDNVNDVFPRPWGFYKSIYLSKFTRSKIICVYPWQKLSLQKHKHREEHWIIINWKWEIILEDSIRKLEKGNYFFIPKWTKHRIINTSLKDNLYFVEVQLWDYFWEDDIIRFNDDYGRAK